VVKLGFDWKEDGGVAVRPTAAGISEGEPRSIPPDNPNPPPAIPARSAVLTDAQNKRFSKRKQ